LLSEAQAKAAASAASRRAPSWLRAQLVAIATQAVIGLRREVDQQDVVVTETDCALIGRVRTIYRAANVRVSEGMLVESEVS
jgi:hypothetical protein